MTNHIKRWIFAPLAILVVAQLVGCSVSSSVAPSAATCNQFLLKLQTHQPQVSYGLLSSKCRVVTTQQQMQKLWDYTQTNHGKVQSWSQKGMQFYRGTDGNWVNLGYDLVCAKSPSEVRFHCVEENGKWVIEGFSFRQ